MMLLVFRSAHKQSLYPCSPVAHPSSRTHCISNVKGPLSVPIRPNICSSRQL